MKDIIIEMIDQAEEFENCELIETIRKLINKFVTTINCPSDWRSIGKELANKYSVDSWVYESLQLWDFED